ncbi:MAG TPA: TonB-dependent receptor plug domain-containing protein, partial [Candidatus Didemnitutus sp.]|nr:TonB-dependent receptor plug domain-containing protein [Candidatus Didemnitutus sp.]
GVSTVRYGYTNGLLTSFTDGSGNVTSYNYQAGTSFLTHWVTPEGRTPLTNTYDATGGVTRQDLGDGFTIDFSRIGNVTTMAYPLGITRTHTHDATERLTGSTSPSGGSASYGYNTQGNRTTVTDMMGGTQTRVFLNGRRTKVTNADGSGQSVLFGDRTVDQLTLDMIEKIEVIDGPSTIYGNDAVRGVINLITKSTGEKKTFTYSPLGHLPSTVTDFYGSTQFQYTADGLVSSCTAPDGSTYAYTYNPAGFLLNIKKNNVDHESFTYDLRGYMTEWVRGGNSTKASYDKDGLCTRFTDAENRHWTNVYDQRSRLIEVRNPTGLGATYSWIGPVLRTMEFGDGQKYTLTPNTDGFPNILANLSGDQWTLTSNKEGDPTSLALPDGTSWNFTSDPMGRTTGITSPLGRTLQLEYDHTGLLEWQRQMGRGHINSYWNAEQTEKTVKLGSSITLSMDRIFTEANKLNKTITDADGHEWEQVIDGASRTSTFTSPTGRTSKLSYGTDWKLTTVDFGLGASLSYQYGNGTTTVSDGTSSRTTTTNKVGETTSVNGEAIGRDGAGRMTSALGVSATRTPGGRVTSYSWGTKAQATYDYDQRGYLVGVTDRLGGKTTISYTLNGKTKKVDMPGGFSLNYDWNTDGQITKVSSSDNWWMTYEYNTNGQIATIIRSDNVPYNELPSQNIKEVSYNADNHPTDATYDAYYNMTKVGSMQMEYDFDGFGLRGFTRGSMTWDYTADALGYPQRINNGANVTDNFVFNHLVENPTLAQHTTPEGRWDIVGTASGKPLYSINDMGVYNYFIDDGRGNVVAERKSDGTLASSRLITPFGVTVGKTGNPGVIGYQAHNGMISLNNDLTMIDGGRIYDPELGRMRNRIGVLDGFPSRLDPYGSYPDCWDDDPWYDDDYEAECTVRPYDLRPRLEGRISVLPSFTTLYDLERPRLPLVQPERTSDYSIGAKLKVDLSNPQLPQLDYTFPDFKNQDEEQPTIFDSTLWGVMEKLFPPRPIETEPRVDIEPKHETPRKK